MFPAALIQRVPPTLRTIVYIIDHSYYKCLLLRNSARLTSLNDKCYTGASLQKANVTHDWHPARLVLTGSTGSGRLSLPTALAISAFLISFLMAFPGLASAQTPGPKPFITQAVNETKLTRLAGNTHPLARPEFDQGAAPPSLRMQRMLLVLTRSADQETALQTLLQEQQDQSSPSFHKWLTPGEFGQQFGASGQDVQTVAAWLAAHGFQVTSVSNGRNVIEFSGTAAQVQEAFHTTIHSYVVNGGQYWANDSDPQIPSALATVVMGVDSLDSFPRKPMHHLGSRSTKPAQRVQPNQTKPLLTSQCGSNPNTGAPLYCNAVTPYDFATIYNVLPLWNATPPIDGNGQAIAIVGRSNINVQDVSDFRTVFGLPPNPPQIILDGPDPGIVQGDETEADLDVEWAGAVARSATIKLVVSESTETTDGVDLSALYIVDNDVAPIMSESFGQCELFMGTAGNQFYKNLWEQAAAQGISVFVSAGDQGSAGCDFFQGTTPQPARNGLQVSGIASTPYDVAVGGTDFNDFSNPLLYWNTANNPSTQESAKGYVPETTWNDSCTNALFANFGFSTNAESNCNNSQLSGAVGAFGGSGGKSGCTTPSGSTPSSCAGGYAKPPWQTGNGVPSDNKRDLPDVSLFAADGFIGNSYAMCEADLKGPCNASNFVNIGGTSASSPAFAGLLALVDQKMASRQGNPNFILYKLATQQPASSCNSTTGPAANCAFNDVTSGTIAMPCATGSLNCTTSNSGDQFGILSGYNAATGYDLATGLGSVNANNMVSSWSSVKFTASSTTLTLNGGSAVNVTHGAPVNVSVSVSPTSPQPTGDVSLIATQGTNTTGLDTLTLSSGTASGSTNMLPGGASYIVQAHYAGDATYGGSDSNAVTVTVTPEASKTFANLVTLDANGNPTSFSSSSFTYGSGSFLFRVDVGDSTASLSSLTGISSTCSNRVTNCPTGAITLISTGSPLPSGSLSLNIEGFAEEQGLSPGAYAITANYPGDSSYGPSSATTNFTISKAPTTVSAATLGSPVQYGNDEEISATVLTTSQGIAPTGTFSFSLDGSPLTTSSLVYEGFPYNPNSSPPFYATLSGTGTAVFLSLGSHTIAAQYSGDSIYASANGSPSTFTVTQAQPFFASYGASPNSVNVNQQVTLAARIFGSDAGVAPTGTITFYDNNNAIPGTVTYTPVPPAQLTVSALGASMPYVPTTPGIHNITVSYSGDSNYLPATSSPAPPAPLTVLGPDFVVASSGATAQTVAAGQTATFANAISVSDQDGFSAQVTLSCSTAAAATACSVNPASLASGNTTVTVTTTVHGIVSPPMSNKRFVNRPQLIAVPLFTFVLQLAIGFWRFGKRHGLRVASTLLLLATALFLTLGAATGCGGGSNSMQAPPPPPPPSGTQPGTYIVNVTGTSGTLTHSTTLTLVVQ